MKSATLIIILHLFFIESYSQISNFNWLVGSWKLQNKNTYEVWKVSSDNKSLEGKSFKVTITDTLMNEEIKLSFYDNSYYYIPDVAGDQGPVRFKIIDYNENGFTAENPDHDFPKRIRYDRRREHGKDFIAASIEGNGKTISYLFEKVLLNQRGRD